jgi:hypothetical protein
MSSSATAVPRWYWVAAGLALVWMLIGVLSLVMDIMTDAAALAAMPEGQRQLYESRPQWVFGVYAVATISGLLGATGLVMRRRWAVTLLAVSLASVVVQFGYTFLVMDAIGKIGAAMALPLPIVIVVAGVLSLWLAKTAAQRGWLA